MEPANQAFEEMTEDEIVEAIQVAIEEIEIDEQAEADVIVDVMIVTPTQVTEEDVELDEVEEHVNNPLEIAESISTDVRSVSPPPNTNYRSVSPALNESYEADISTTNSPNYSFHLTSPVLNFIENPFLSGDNLSNRSMRVSLGSPVVLMANSPGHSSRGRSMSPNTFLATSPNDMECPPCPPAARAPAARPVAKTRVVEKMDDQCRPMARPAKVQKKRRSQKKPKVKATERTSKALRRSIRIAELEKKKEIRKTTQMACSLTNILQQTHVVPKASMKLNQTRVIKGKTSTKKTPTTRVAKTSAKTMKLSQLTKVEKRRTKPTRVVKRKPAKAQKRLKQPAKRPARANRGDGCS